MQFSITAAFPSISGGRRLFSQLGSKIARLHGHLATSRRMNDCMDRSPTWLGCLNGGNACGFTLTQAQSWMGEPLKGRYDRNSTHAHRIYWPSKNSVSVERNVRFASTTVTVYNAPLPTNNPGKTPSVTAPPPPPSLPPDLPPVPAPTPPQPQAI